MVHTKGESCIKQGIFGGEKGNKDDRLQRALDDAILKGREKVPNGDLLVNVRIDHNMVDGKFGKTDCIFVEGDLVSIKK